MGDVLKARIKQQHFVSQAHETMLNLIVAAGHVRLWVEQACADHDLTQAQYNVLRILRGAHPAGYPRGEIASRMVDRAPDVTRLIDRLERQGLVERDRSDRDRRLSLTRITPAGLALLARLDPRIHALDERLSARMTPEDLAHLSRLCEQLYGPDLADTSQQIERPADE